MLEPDEHVRGVADGRAAAGHLVATSLGPVAARRGRPRRVGWHLVSKATWEGGALAVIEAREVETVEGAVLLADRAAAPVRLADAGPGAGGRARAGHRARSGRRHHRELPGGGAWFVQRKVPGRDGIVLQVRRRSGHRRRTRAAGGRATSRRRLRSVNSTSVLLAG